MKRELGQAGSLALALEAGGMIGRQGRDQPLDTVADLQREVGRGGTGERPYVIDRDLTGQAVRALALAHLD
jgi:hypothetical protein